MMGGTERRPLAEAEALAREVVGLLEPHCERIQVAGSIRRRRSDVGDIEVVCISKTEVATTTDLFGIRTTDPLPILDPFVEGLLASGTFQPRLNAQGRPAIGPRLKWLIHNGFALDIYTATPETWGVTLAIRTGSAEFSHRLVTPRHQGGLCPSHLHFKGWRVCQAGGAALPTPDEAEVFRALGLEWLAPDLRTDEAEPKRLVPA